MRFRSKEKRIHRFSFLNKKIIKIYDFLILASNVRLFLKIFICKIVMKKVFKCGKETIAENGKRVYTERAISGEEE